MHTSQEILKYLYAVATIILIVLFINSCHRLTDGKFIPVGLLPSKSLVDTTFNRLFEQQIAEQMDQYQCPGMAVLVMKNNQIIYEKQFGAKSRYSPDAIDSTSVFRLGSVSKGFAGILAAILIDKKMIHLEDPVSFYIPNFTFKAKNKDKILRVKHILSHTSGLTEHAFSNLVDENVDREILVSYLNKLTPRDSTGKTYAYQNAAFGLIEKVIEEATGMTYEKAMDFYIFSPLGMCGSSCTFEDLIGTDNICHGHKYSRNGFVPVDIKPHYYNVPSAGGINAHLKDMRSWMSAIMGYYPDVISPNARDLAFNEYVETSADRKQWNRWEGFVSSHYGLGWRIIHTKSNHIVYHGGLVNGFRSEIAFDKNKDIGVVFLFNSVCSYSNFAVEQFFNLWNTYHKDDEVFL
jgi:beta-lactamase class C